MLQVGQAEQRREHDFHATERTHHRDVAGCKGGEPAAGKVPATGELGDVVNVLRNSHGSRQANELRGIGVCRAFVTTEANDAHGRMLGRLSAWTGNLTSTVVKAKQNPAASRTVPPA